MPVPPGRRPSATSNWLIKAFPIARELHVQKREQIPFLRLLRGLRSQQIVALLAVCGSARTWRSADSICQLFVQVSTGFGDIVQDNVQVEM